MHSNDVNRSGCSKIVILEGNGIILPLFRHKTIGESLQSLLRNVSQHQSNYALLRVHRLTITIRITHASRHTTNLFDVLVTSRRHYYSKVRAKLSKLHPSSIISDRNPVVYFEGHNKRVLTSKILTGAII